LLVALYDRVLVDVLTAAMRGLGSVVGSSLLQGTDLRGDNFLVFGLLLYLATLIPGRVRTVRSTPPTAEEIRTSLAA
jgi:hypothetical protein